MSVLLDICFNFCPLQNDVVKFVEHFSPGATNLRYVHVKV